MLSTSSYVESVRLSGSVAVQASKRSFRLHRSYLWEFAPFSESLTESGDVDVTRQTMAGAIHAGASERPPEPDATDDHQTSLLSYIYDLATAYHTTHSTPPTMRRAGDRLAASGRQHAARICYDVAEKESGDDQLALDDLAALGVPVKRYIQRVRPRHAVVAGELFTTLAESDDPVAVLGYVYTLERLAILTDAEAIAARERQLPPGVVATRCLRAHSAVGPEVQHLAGLTRSIAALGARDRAAIARAAYVTSRTVTEPNDYPGDDAMVSLLKAVDAAG